MRKGIYVPIFYVNHPDFDASTYDALFGNINNAKISNLGLESGSVISQSTRADLPMVFAAGLVAYARNSYLYNCSSLVTVTATVNL